MSKATQAIPPGQEHLIPHLACDKCSEAIEFYKKAFGAEEVARMGLPGGPIMHAEIKIGDSLIMLSEAMQQGETRSTMHIYTADADALFARAVAAGATVKMPLADQFWGDRYGLVVDPNGNTWGIATHKKDVTREEMEKAAKEFAASKK